MANSNKLTRNEIQSLFADYVTGKLNSDEIIKFEESLLQFPELQDEVNKYKNSFDKVNKAEITNLFDIKSRNISVKFEQRLNSISKSQVKRNYYLVPAISVSLILILIMIFNKPDEMKIDSISVVSNNDLKELITNEILNDSTINPLNLNDYSYTPAMMEASVDYDNFNGEDLDDVVMEQIAEKVNISNNDISAINENDLISLLDNLDNTEFQSIIEELNNVKINP